MVDRVETPEKEILRRAWAALPLAGRYQVVVVGGGPAGCAAAIAAAREGARTLLVEQHGFLGGMGTAGLVPAFCPFSDRQRAIVGGIGRSVLEEMKGLMPHVDAEALDWVPIDHEGLKRIYERRVQEAGAEILFLTHFVDVTGGKDGRIDGVVLHNKSGLQRFAADVVVDCTGDADVVAAAGVPTVKGDPESGDLQPCTMCFVLAGIDNRRFQEFLWADDAKNLLLKGVIAEAKAAGDLNIVEEAGNVAYQSASTIAFNFSHVFDVDATDAAQLSAAHIEGRKIIRHLTNFVRKYCPGCEDAYLVTSGTQIGVRETRRIEGDYILTLEDYLARRSFDDEIARNAYYIDIHLSRRDWAAKLEASGKFDEEIHQYGPGESHGVPYRSLLPRGLTNVIVAGRCISTDRAVQGATRVMPNCLATGEAAGCAAGLVAQNRASPVRELDPRELRTRLRAHGQYLPEQ